jgi:subtilisin family serine protease
VENTGYIKKGEKMNNRSNGRHNLIITFGISALALILMVGGAGAAHYAGTELFHGKEAVAGDVLVKFRAATPQGINQAEINENIDEAEYVGSTHVMRFHSRSKNIDTLISELSRRADVEYAEPNYIVHAIAIPDDPSFGQLWGLQNTGQPILGVSGKPGADISAPLAWDISTGSTANVVAVVDTGINYTHPDLAANIWSAPTTFSVTIGSNRITCPAGSHGFNAISNTCDPMDDNNHGTHVSGTIGASGNNGLGVVGVNWKASIMGSKFLDASGSGTLANAINAIDFAIQTKTIFGGAANIRVLSNSWGGGGFSQALLDEINKANANDMLFVAAAGNSASNNDVTPFYPSNYDAPNVVAVAATDNKDSLASFSNYGTTTVDLGAPGVSVLSTIKDGSYSYFSGTSMATPHVSGAAILILSKCALNTTALKANILNNVDPISSLTGKTVTGGRLNVNKAIRACSAAPAPDFSLSATPSSQTVIQGASTSYTINIIPSGGFTLPVTLDVSGLPGKAITSFSPNPTTASSTMTVTTSTTTPAGSYTLIISGTNGTLTHTTTVVLNIPDFSLSALPGFLSIAQGTSKTSTITVGSLNGFTGTVDLSLSGIPANASSSLSPTSVTNSGTSTMTVNAGTAIPGSYQLTVTGTSGTLTHNTIATINITAPQPSDFSISASPTSRTVGRGASTTYAVTIDRLSGFAGAVNFSVTGLPSGALATFNPNQTTGTSSTLSITTRPTTPTGSYQLTITGTSSSLSHTTLVTLIINKKRN